MTTGSETEPRLNFLIYLFIFSLSKRQFELRLAIDYYFKKTLTYWEL